jgi:DNA repair protein RecO (recombination protein O)
LNLFKTRGVVLTHLRYRDTSIIVKIYTEAFGLKSYLVNGVRSGRGHGGKMALYQPLNLVDLVVYNRETQQLHRISEIRLAHPYQTIPYQVRKSTVCLLLTEVLAKTLTEAKAEPYLFDFLYQSLLTLDQPQVALEQFPLVFLLGLAQQLGFGAESAAEVAGQLAAFGHWPDDGLAPPLQALIERPDEPLGLPRPLRAALLDALLRFFALHVDGFGELKSLPVLREL